MKKLKIHKINEHMKPARIILYLIQEEPQYRLHKVYHLWKNHPCSSRDMSKAFYTVHHGKHLIAESTLPPHLKRWIANYIQGRQTYVDVIVQMNKDPKILGITLDLQTSHQQTWRKIWNQGTTSWGYLLKAVGGKMRCYALELCHTKKLQRAQHVDSNRMSSDY